MGAYLQAFSLEYKSGPVNTGILIEWQKMVLRSSAPMVAPYDLVFRGIPRYHIIIATIPGQRDLRARSGRLVGFYKNKFVFMRNDHAATRLIT